MADQVGDSKRNADGNRCQKDARCARPAGHGDYCADSTGEPLNQAEYHATKGGDAPAAAS